MATSHIRSACPARANPCVRLQGWTGGEPGPLHLVLHPCLGLPRPLLAVSVCWFLTSRVSAQQLLPCPSVYHLHGDGSGTEKKGYRLSFFTSFVLLDPVFVLSNRSS